ncbi:hypothetical protein JW992_11805 [candidate division KSB1 bacterium]|nr:hypothetical protein [candidate division KSB1 bacterium]
MKVQYHHIAAIFLLAFFAAAWGNVDLVLENGIVVETSRVSNDYPVYVELSGDLTESGASYFIGKITSGTRSSTFSKFAGFDWKTAIPAASTVTRITLPSSVNPPLTPGGPATAWKRYWTVNNSGGAVSGNFDVRFATAAHPYNEKAGTAPYRVWRLAASWANVEPSVEESATTGEWTVFNTTGATLPAGSSTWYGAPYEQLVARLFAKICFQGLSYRTDNPYLISPPSQAGQIHHQFMQDMGFGQVPSTSPFRDHLAGPATMPDHVADWIWIAVVTDPSDVNSIVTSRSVFVDIFGNILESDGTTPGALLDMEPNPTTNYYVLFRHRNHVAVMTQSMTGEQLAALSASAPYDFTQSTDQYYTYLLKNGSKQISLQTFGGGTRQIWAAVASDGYYDTNNWASVLNNYIDGYDSEQTRTDALQMGYGLMGDYDCTGYVDGYDSDLSFQNAIEGTVLPMPKDILQ